MQNARGNLLVSTKAEAKVLKTIMIIACGFYLILALFFLFNLDMIAYIGRRLLGNAVFGWCFAIIILVFVILWPVYVTIRLFLKYKSYIDVYENAVVGTTVCNNTPSVNFELGYDEIVKIDESGKDILIYTSYTNYQAAALKNHAAAVQAIRARMKGQTASR